jgi:predicted transcriptional regulator
MPEEAPTAPVVRELATRIVIAYVRRNQIGADQLAAVISTVHQTLVGLGKPQPAISEPAIPAVPIRQSVRRDHVICLDCGWRGQMLRRHITTSHGLGVQEYRNRWNLRPEHPLTAPGYSELRSSMVKQLGLGRTRTTSDDASEPAAAKSARPRRRARPRAGSKPST